MNPNDVVESFHAMDQEKTGEITAQQCYTLCLGMGTNVRRADLDALILQCNDDDDKGNHNITVDVVLKLLEMLERDERDELDKCFQLISSNNNDNKITPHDLVKLSRDVGEPVSLEQAQAMMQHWNGEWSKADLESILSSSSSTSY